MKYCFFLCFTIFLLVFQSCSLDRKLAREFIESEPEISFLVIPVNYIYKFNLKDYELGPDTVNMTKEEIDSVLFEKSLFLKDISDSVFLTVFYNSFFDELEKLHINVYTEEQFDTFLTLKTPAYIINVAQIEIDEYKKKYVDSEEINETEYRKAVPVDAVSISTWYEISKVVDGKQGSVRKFYAEDEIHDIVSGYFTEDLYSGQVTYKYFIRNMDVDDIYERAEILGEKYAGYFFDYVMNAYISKNFPEDMERTYYMHYNRWINSLEPAGDNRFILME